VFATREKLSFLALPLFASQLIPRSNSFLLNIYDTDVDSFTPADVPPIIELPPLVGHQPLITPLSFG
jgi:hypothetical protein